MTQIHKTTGLTIEHVYVYEEQPLLFWGLSISRSKVVTCPKCLIRMVKLFVEEV